MGEKSNETKTKSPGKIVNVIVTIVLAIVALVGLFFIYNLLNPNPFYNGLNKLETVSNIHYDYDTYKLTWDTVEHADLYKVSINGKNQDVDTNSLDYVPAVVSTSITIKAVDTSFEYHESDWSETFTFEAKEESLYAKLGTYMTNFSARYQEIINAYTQDGSLFVNALCTKNGTVNVYKLQLDYENPVTSIQDAINQKVRHTRVIHEYEMIDYDSAQYLLVSKSYAGEMEQRRIEGYQFSVVSSRVAKGEYDNIYYIYATYKITNGAEVKYIQQVTECRVNLTYSEQINYTTRLLDLDNRSVKELSYVELTGDALKLAIEMEKINSIGEA